jgi:hypothetical protein
MTEDERVAWETMQAWREARDKTQRGSKQYQEFDKEFRAAEQAYYRAKP